MQHEADDHSWMQRAIEESKACLSTPCGGPFGAVIVKDNQLIACAHNEVLANHDPTAHAEVVAIRRACQAMRHFHLPGCIIYSSCEPCPMCFAAICWAQIDTIVYASTRQDAAAIGFSDAALYTLLKEPSSDSGPHRRQCLQPEAQCVMQQWSALANKVNY